MNSYSINDRTTVDIWRIEVEDEQIKWTSRPGDTPLADPVYLDGATYWTIYIDDGELVWEQAGSVDSGIILNDTVISTRWRLRVTDEEFNLFSEGIFLVTLRGAFVNELVNQLISIDEETSQLIGVR